MYIIGGLIKTMAGEDIEDGYLRVGDGKITEIGKRDEMSFHTAPHEQINEDRQGMIMPGIIEAHCEFSYKSRVMATNEPLITLKAPYMERNPMKWGFFRLKSG